MAARHGLPRTAVRRKVAAIVAEVRRDGDEAVRRLTREIDGVSLEDYRVPAEALPGFLERLPRGLRQALELASGRIRAVHRAEMPEPVSEVPASGGLVARVYREPLRRVAVYVPAGRAPLPSSVLMGCLPAQTAGVEQIAVVTPPGRNGGGDPTTLAACALLGIEEVYLVGGAQAVAAAACGTATLPRVDKVVGPGNAWVTEAKRQLQGVVGIDGLNGPSEVVIWAEPPAPARQLALDLLAQAEHDPESWAVLLTSSAPLRSAVEQELEQIVRSEGNEALLRQRGFGAVLLRHSEDAIDWIRRFAPEHLELWGPPTEAAADVRGAAATFVGCPTPLGDYAAGPNHILPTGGSARFASALGVWDFLRRRTETHAVGDASGVVDAAIALAGAEGLRMHREALQGFREVTAQPWTTALRSS